MDISSLRSTVPQSFDVRKGELLTPTSSKEPSKDDRNIFSQEYFEKIMNKTPEDDRLHENHIKTLNTPMTAIFRVDGVIIGATFGEQTMANNGQGSLTFPEGVERSFENVKAAYEKIFGDRLEVEQFTGVNRPVLRDFDNGDFFTQADLDNGWTPVQHLTDKEFAEGLAKIKGYHPDMRSNTAGFKAKG